MKTLAQLLNAPSQDQIRARWVSGLVALGIRADLWRAGGTASSILTILARTFSGFAATLTSAIQAGFLGYATGPWLVLLAYYVFGVTATPATAAVGTLILTNSGGGIYNKASGSVTATNPLNGQTYVNLDAFTLGAMGTASVLFQATTPGSVGSSPAGAINTLVTTIPGVTVTNPAPFVGQDADSDATVVSKCQSARASRSYLGPTGAYEAAVRGAINGSGNPVAINRVSVVNLSDMAVNVYVASPAGVPTAEDIDAAADAVQQLAQPMNITATVIACTPVTYSPTVTLWAQLGAPSPATLIAEAQSLILDYFAIFPISGLRIPPSTQGFMFATAITGVLKGTDATIFDVVGVPNDVPINAGQVLVWNGTILVRTLPAP